MQTGAKLAKSNDVCPKCLCTMKDGDVVKMYYSGEAIEHIICPNVEQTIDDVELTGSVK